MDKLILQSLIKDNPHLKNGFYIYKNKIYINKVEALIEATKDNSDIQWYFNDQIFSEFNWMAEPPESVELLYKKRALQIRESFDYVILMFSGGSDSVNMLRTFLDNNINIDKICTMTCYHNHLDKKFSLPNIEITLAAHPLLEQAAKKNISIEIVNQMDHDPALDSEWWKDSPSMHLSPDNIFRKEIYFNKKDIKNLVDRGKKVCVVLGIDKPKLRFMDNSWYLSFLDTTNHSHWKSQHSFQNGPYLIYFYYAPEMPELISKSCWSIIEYFERNWTLKNCKKFWTDGNIHGNDKVNLYNSIVNFVLYKNTWNDSKMFSIGKAHGYFSQFYNQKTIFLFDKNSEWKNLKIWKNGLEEIYKSINPKWYVKDKQIQGHWTKNYKIKTYENRRSN